MYNYGLIGNCQTSVLVSKMASLDWWCLPRPDSPPVFGKLVDDEGGHCSVQLAGASRSHQYYQPNTNVLVTHLYSSDGSEIRITDFSPRFTVQDKVYRPNSIYRVIEPVAGHPVIQISCRPVNGWEKQRVLPVREKDFLKYKIQDEFLYLSLSQSVNHSVSLSVNQPLINILEESSFPLTEPLYLGLAWAQRVEGNLNKVVNDFLTETTEYWKTWVKHCSIPSLYQKETVRSALTLKLHCFEDTGAILAALTTSLPEENEEGRNWDYRFCWLRDAYYVLSAFHNLGHFEEMEKFLGFLLNIAERHEHSRERLRPVYRLDQSLPLPEQSHANWKGFNGNQPVRSNNQAAEHIQNDVYGEMVLTLAPIFFDQRFHHLRTKEHQQLLANLVKQCIRNISQPDAGLWEIRNGWQEHSFSNLMCWAGIERMKSIQKLGFFETLDLNLEEAQKTAEDAIIAAVKEGTLRNGPKDDSFDAALLQLPILRYPDSDLNIKTVREIIRNLKLGDADNEKYLLYRYLRKDDFGNPKSAFLICSFWLVQALARTGQIAEAHEAMKAAMGGANHLGLLSEHFVSNKRVQMGNFPQAYSHVGQINAAFAISPPWSDVL
ncbi:MAG: glycoside hydrolase family 15 protein [Bdellovibrionia bacterium]